CFVRPSLTPDGRSRAAGFARPDRERLLVTIRHHSRFAALDRAHMASLCHVHIDAGIAARRRVVRRKLRRLLDNVLRDGPPVVLDDDMAAGNVAGVQPEVAAPRALGDEFVVLAGVPPDEDHEAVFGGEAADARLAAARTPLVLPLPVAGLLQ